MAIEVVPSAALLVSTVTTGWLWLKRETYEEPMRHLEPKKTRIITMEISLCE
ncbi:unnamed protein product, partial [Allacma fusca]